MLVYRQNGATVSGLLCQGVMLRAFDRGLSRSVHHTLS